KFHFLPNRKSKARDLARVIEDIPYKNICIKFNGITIPADYITDFASIPDGVVWFMHPNSKKVRMASLGHDLIWDEREYFQRKLGLSGHELKKLSNKEFRMRCMADGVDRFRAYIMYVILQYHPKANRWFWDVENNFGRLDLGLDDIDRSHALPI
ncbi:MAG: DUF1353 domain-containing protein, partial [Bacteroidota bacterium]